MKGYKSIEHDSALYLSANILAQYLSIDWYGCEIDFGRRCAILHNVAKSVRGMIIYYKRIYLRESE